jgi:hypothetical protein
MYYVVPVGGGSPLHYRTAATCHSVACGSPTRRSIVAPQVLQHPSCSLTHGAHGVEANGCCRTAALYWQVISVTSTTAAVLYHYQGEGQLCRTHTEATGDPARTHARPFSRSKVNHWCPYRRGCWVSQSAGQQSLHSALADSCALHCCCPASEWIPSCSHCCCTAALCRQE